jgi:hypothetical protein
MIIDFYKSVKGSYFQGGDIYLQPVTEALEVTDKTVVSTSTASLPRSTTDSAAHLGVNTIDAGIMVVNGINTIWENPVEGWSVKTTKFNSNGIINNAIPDGVDLAFDLRAQKNPVCENP